MTGANSTIRPCCLSPGVKPCSDNPPQKSRVSERLYRVIEEQFSARLEAELLLFGFARKFIPTPFFFAQLVLTWCELQKK